MRHLFDTSESKTFGRLLGGYVLTTYVPLASGDSVVLNRKTKPIFDRLASDIASFVKANRPNMLQRASVANEFKWLLREQNLPNQVIDDMTEWVVICLNKR
jgi:hypothetical protein